MPGVALSLVCCFTSSSRLHHGDRCNLPPPSWELYLRTSLYTKVPICPKLDSALQLGCYSNIFTDSCKSRGVNGIRRLTPVLSRYLYSGVPSPIISTTGRITSKPCQCSACSVGFPRTSTRFAARPTAIPRRSTEIIPLCSCRSCRLESFYRGEATMIYVQ